MRPARVVHVGRGDALHPGVHVQDRADVGMGPVDHPMLDRIDRDASRLDTRWNAEDDDSALVVEVLDHEEITADGLELRLVDAARAHPEARLVLAGGEIPV